jgi:GH43 family beta-xylosidase/alpha-L-arabinofuranosidase
MIKIFTRTSISLFLFALATLSCMAQAALDPLEWSNPILRQRADPHVTLHTDGYYYFTATVPEYDRIELRRARTLGGLSTADAKVVWRKHARGPMSHHIWAPEIHFADGKWYIYFAAGRAEAIWDIRMYVLENSSSNPLEGTWTEKGEIRMNWESFTLDATTFVHRGVRYLAWAQSVPEERGTRLFIARMDTPWSIAGKQVSISRPDLPWERIGHNVNEAPAVIHRNGRLFMTYSASATDANYCLGLLTADENADLLDPGAWKKSPRPVFASNRANSQFGPGHNCFTTTPDGKTDILVYHARNYEHINGEPLNNPDRATRAQILRWNDDGTPNFGVPVPDGRRRVHDTGVAATITATTSSTGPVTITVNAAEKGRPMPATLHGLFYEDINYAADGGLYAELVQNRSFEHRDALYSWSETASSNSRGNLAVESELPLNANNRHFLRIRSGQERGEYGVENSGFGGIALKAGEKYLFSVYARLRAGQPTARVVLKDSMGDILAEQKVRGLSRDWKKFKLTLPIKRSVTDARLALLVQGEGTVDFDMVSLFPENTFKGRRNGMRADLAQALADMKPGFLRFPGGCIVEGRDFANMYRWKDTVGDVAERKQNWNLWQNAESPQYHQTYGLGFFEYFQLAEDMGAEPLPVLNCGMCCQARGGKHVPLEELGPFIQDAFDLIEFANGPASSKWGGLRASMGHPKPFNLKYLAVGNEQWEQDYFDRYEIFHKALKAKHPEIAIISTSGPFVNDRLWRFAWDKFNSGTPADIVDEHYYVPPRWLLENVDHYAGYDRKGPKVFVGEFAAHDRNRKNNLRSALAEAAYMTGLWRHSDVVVMASYAPLLAKMDHVQWRPNLIWFDNTRVLLTPNYHAQALFSQHRPESVLPIRVEAPARLPAASGMIGVGTWNTQSEYKDIKVTSADGRTLYEFDPGKGLAPWKTAGGDWQIVDGALRQAGQGENIRAVIGDPSWADYTLTMRARKLSGSEGFLVIFETQDIEAPVWWNLGGWRNTEHGLQGDGLPEQRERGHVETGRWYDIRIETRSTGIRAYLDGKPVQSAERKPIATLFAAAGRNASRGSEEIVLSVVNVGPTPSETEVRLQGAGGVSQQALAWVMTSGSAEDDNDYNAPNRVSPKQERVDVSGPVFKHTFPANSLTILKLKSK